MGTFKLFFEAIEKVLAVLAKVSFLMGGTIMLLYCIRYGGFPDGISVRETLLIFLAFAVFSVGTLIVNFFLMCLGVSLWCLLFRLAHSKYVNGVKPYLVNLRIWAQNRARKRVVNKEKKHWIDGVPSEFTRNYKRSSSILYHIKYPIFTPMFHFLGFLAIVYMKIVIHENYVIWYLTFIVAALALGGWYLFCDVNRQRSAQMDMIFRDAETSSKLRSEIRWLNSWGTAFVFIGVTLFLGLFETTANQTMRLLGVRHDHATVYVRETWSNVLDSHGIKGRKSSLESYKYRYDNVTVALSSFGSSVSLQFHARGESQTLRIPASEVLIDPLIRKKE